MLTDRANNHPILKWPLSRKRAEIMAALQNQRSVLLCVKLRKTDRALENIAKMGFHRVNCS